MRLALVLHIFSAALPAASQMLKGPAESRPQLPSFMPKSPDRGSILPELEAPKEEGLDALRADVQVEVKAIRVKGNHALSDADLTKITDRYAPRALSYADIERLRDELTVAYIQRGYATSGARIPEQSLADGVLEVEIVEGTIERVEIENEGRFRDGYLSGRLRRSSREPVNLATLENRLRILKSDPRVKRLDAQLMPGSVSGKSVLKVKVEEAPLYFVSAEFNNYRSPAIGAEGGQFSAGYRNLTGFGDTLQVGYGVTEGLHDVSGSYQIPISPYDTLLSFSYQQSWSEVIEGPFENLDIESRARTIGTTLLQPLFRSPRLYIDTFVSGDLRRSKSFLLGSGFSFTEGPEDGVSKISAIRIGQNLTYRGDRYVIAARSVVNVGVDALGATSQPSGIPDGEFVSWLGQAQFAQRFDFLDLQLVARVDAQLSDSPLLGLEQLALGGHGSVRGYRENELVRDNGVIGSLELRLPVWQRSTGESIVEVAAFTDSGYGWNEDRETVGPTTLVSTGLGLRVMPVQYVYGEIYWGADLKEISGKSNNDLQDNGVHLRMVVRYP